MPTIKAHSHSFRVRSAVAVTVLGFGAALSGCGSNTDTPTATAGSANAGASGSISSGGASGAAAGNTASAGSTTSGGAAGSATAGMGGIGELAGSGGQTSTGASGLGGGGPGGGSANAGSGGANAGSGGANAGSGGNGGTAGGSAGSGGSGGTPAALKALMVIITAGTPTPGDKVMAARMTARNIQTTFLADTKVTAASAAGMALVVISSSAESGPLGNKLRDVAVPVLCIENGEYPLMGLTGTALNTDYGQITAQSKVQIIAADSPLVAGLSGSVTISTKAGDFGWGIPGNAALKGATVSGNANHFAIFAYDKGAQMVGLTAPARRAAFAIREDLAANLSPDGAKLFDALLNWVLM